MKVAITCPSLDTRVNVSGISSYVSALLEARADWYMPIRTGSPDNAPSRILAPLWRLISASVRLAINRSHCDVLHLNTAADSRAALRDVVLASVGRLFAYRVVTHVHGGKWLTIAPSGRERLAAAAFRVLLKLSQAVIALGPTQRDSLAAFGANKSRLHIVGGIVRGTNLRRARAPHSVLFLGRIERQKGVMLLPDIFMRLLEMRKDAVLHIAGTGPELGALLSELRRLSIPHSYHGVVAGVAKAELLATSWVFILPSLFEGLPIALLEAIASGCLPVTSSVGEMPRLVGAAGGRIVETFDSRDYARALCDLMDSGAQCVSDEARANILEPFSPSAVIAQFPKIYRVPLSES